jgi:DNA helicase II / ATP-dependent DNA helicase PcrA
MFRGTCRVAGVLAKEVRQLNAKQRAAVLHPASTAVRAGPGSGKTRTLVTKIGYLLSSQIPLHQGVAAITYTNQAAQEVGRRLSRLGIEPGRRLSTSTVHSWCLNSILRPYAALSGVPLAEPLTICSDSHAVDLTDECLSRAGADYWKAESEIPGLTSIRRALSAGEGTSGYEPNKVVAACLYDDRLVDLGLIDYEAMVSRALRVVEGNAAANDLIAARYPWLVVDEYQDLGPVLHRLVTVLHDSADVNVFCVGDPDQTVMGFTGADPRYLNELAGRDDFLPVDLEFNYRCGSAIISAASTVLGETREHQADPYRDDAGVVEPIAVRGGLDGHAAVVVEKIRASLAVGIPGHEIAILRVIGNHSPLVC